MQIGTESDRFPHVDHVARFHSAEEHLLDSVSLNTDAARYRG